MAAIIKNELRVKNSDMLRRYASTNPVYVLLSGQNEWNDETQPPIPVDSTDDENLVMADVVGIKRILPNDMVSVVPRTNWTNGTVYDQYDNSVNLIDEENPETGDLYRFYVITEDFNVYKCLSNNYRANSTTRPSGTSPEPFQTPDGYIWKYMYTVQASEAFKFMTTNWMPCYTLQSDQGSTQWNNQQAAVPGTIDNIEVVNAGANYDDSNPPSVQIDGDGSGATAVAVVNNTTGEISDITVTNSGSNYTYADITIVDTGSGVGATARAIVGPRKGHGSDPRVELGATYLMVKVEIQGDEGGVFPTGVEYRISGMIGYPVEVNATGLAMGIADVKLFSAGETITGSNSGATGNIRLVDEQNNILYIDSIVGEFFQNDNISSQSYNSSQILSINDVVLPLTGLTYSGTDIEPNTGNLLYIGFREKITRAENQNEEIISILSF